MPEPVDLLLITWNRRTYVERSLPDLLADPADFRLHCWDNASTDGTADIIAGLDDPRVVARHFSKQNVKQRDPCLWFFDRAAGDLVGKVDDDLLLPTGWTERIAPLLRREPRFGMLGCWVFMPDDWDEELGAHKVIAAGGARVFRSIGFAGAAFLARKETLRRYILPPEQGYGLPIDRTGMSLDGLINGCPLPLLLAHHMDDPRSPHCLANTSGDGQSPASVTARVLGFSTQAEYAAWITADARRSLLEPFDQELAQERRKRDRSLPARLRRKVQTLWKRIKPARRSIRRPCAEPNL